MTDAKQKTLLALAWPLIISFTARSLLGSIDLVYASKISDDPLVTDAAVAAIGLFFPLEFAFVACWVGTSAALTSYLSKAMGERHEGQLEQLLRTSGGVAVALSAFFVGVAGLLYLLAPALATTTELSTEVAEAFRVYGSTAMAGIALCAFWSILPDSLIKAHHDTRSTMIAGLISGLLNVALNTLFVFGFKWGLFGIGLATGLARLGSLLYALHRARVLEAERIETWKVTEPPRKRRGQRPGYTKEGLLNRPLASLLALGVPSALTYVLMGAESAMVNAVLSRLGDATQSLAAYTIYHRGVLLLLMPVIAVAVAVLPFVARVVGEKRYDDVRRELRGAFLLACAYVLFVAAPLCFFGAELIVNFLSKGEGTRDLATLAIRYAAPASALAAMPFVLCRPAFEALQRGGPGLVMAFVRYVLLSAPLALLGGWIAQRLGHEPFLGILAGLIVGSGVTSLVFASWLARDLGALGKDTKRKAEGAGA